MVNPSTKELSIDEILASIRGILHENNQSEPPMTGSRKETMTDYHTPTPNIEIVEDDETEDEEADVPEKEDIASIYAKIKQIIRYSEDKSEAFAPQAEEKSATAPLIEAEVSTPDHQPDLPDDHNLTESSPAPISPAEISAPLTNNLKDSTSQQIVRQFGEIFAHRQTQNPQADDSIRKLAQSAVINEVIPVLQQWLDDYLPLLVRQEIERIMIKNGKKL